MTLHAWLAAQEARADAEPAALVDELAEQLRRDPAAAGDADVARFRAWLAEHVVTGPGGTATSLAFGVDGRWLVAAFPSALLTIDVASGEIIATVACLRIPHRLTPAADAVWVLVAREHNGTLFGCAWERRVLPSLALAGAGEDDGTLLAIRADGARLVSRGELVLVEGGVSRTLRGAERRYESWGAFDGSVAVTGSPSLATVRVWDLAAGEQIAELARPDRLDLAIYRDHPRLEGLPVGAVAFAGDVAVVASRGGAFVWDVAARREVRRLWDAPSAAVAIGPGDALAIATGDAVRLAGLAAPRRPRLPWRAEQRGTAGSALARTRARAEALVDAAAIDPVAALAELDALRAATPELRDEIALWRRLHRTIAPFALVRAATTRFVRTLTTDRVWGYHFDPTDEHLLRSTDAGIEISHALDGHLVDILGARRTAVLGVGTELVLAIERVHDDHAIVVLDRTRRRLPIQLPGLYGHAAIHPTRPLVVALRDDRLVYFEGDFTRPAREVACERPGSTCAFVAGELLVSRRADGAVVRSAETGAELRFFDRGMHVGGLAGAWPSSDGRAIAFRRQDADGTEVHGLAGGYVTSGHHIVQLGALVGVGVRRGQMLELVDPRTLLPLAPIFPAGDGGLVAASHDEGLLVFDRERRTELWLVEPTWAFLEDILDDRCAILDDADCGLQACLDAWHDLRRLAQRPGVGAEALARVAAARERVASHIARTAPHAPIERVAIALVDRELVPVQLARIRLRIEGGAVFDLADYQRIGRHPDCEIQILDRTMSKEHCAITRRGDRYELRDLSLTGTFVGDRRIATHDLVPGEIVTAGATRFALERA